VVSRMVSISVGFVLTTSLAVLVISCDESRRYKVVTFFFDGVDAPGSLELAGESGDPNSLAPEAEAAGPIWYVHEPRKDCTVCHGRRGQRRPTARAFLVSPVPQLCYDCHEDRMVRGPNVHGPVAVGQCLLCHNPHKSRVKYLLKGPVPELCYFCHDTTAVEDIPAHYVRELAACMDCHDPHASLERPLLKDEARRLSAERAISEAARIPEKPGEQQFPAAQKPLARPQADSAELRKLKQEIADIFYASMDSYRDGKLIKAREGLVTVLESGLIPRTMGTTIRSYIADIDRRLMERTQPPDSQR